MLQNILIKNLPLISTRITKFKFDDYFFFKFYLLKSKTYRNFKRLFSTTMKIQLQVLPRPYYRQPKKELPNFFLKMVDTGLAQLAYFSHNDFSKSHPSFVNTQQ